MQKQQNDGDQSLNVFWFRRDLRLEDNKGLFYALQDGLPVLPLFIFDTDILDDLKDKQDKRVQFIHQSLQNIQAQLREQDSSLMILHGQPLAVWAAMVKNLNINKVYTNHDYEPYATQRDQSLAQLLNDNGIEFVSHKDQVVFEKNEVLTKNDQPYMVFTPYKNRWMDQVNARAIAAYSSEKKLDRLMKLSPLPIPSLQELGFQESSFAYPAKSLLENIIKQYHKNRDFPGMEGTTRLGIHLRFGTISPRSAVRFALQKNETWLSELIWREFYMMILWHFPHVVDTEFKEKYRNIKWRYDQNEFERWCIGQTGYPMVDAGMRQLNESGYMHNRVRMITAGFLTKHLLIDWRWGERYFAEKLLDYELASNNGNWQWAAGSGCDAAPYFRIFNPQTQQQKFDPDLKYIMKWVPEYQTDEYPRPMIEHRYARERALNHYKSALD
ncbi:MAG: deoxyribodipyrimidine photo-lyase [Caldithrix sp.]|nr:deoxyribodipyrimidine photo-lyase [Caldithrix sp.]